MTSSSQLRVAIAGAGMVSRHHLIAWSRNPDAEVVAIADPNEENAEQRAAEFDIPRTYRSLSELLENEALDALDIAAPMEVHGRLIGLAAECGIATLCQKPLASTATEAEEIARCADGRIRLMVHENWRFRPHYRHIKAWLDEGRIGVPKAFRLGTLSSALLTQANGAPPPGLVRQPFFATMKRLLVLELLVHHLDALGFLLGPLDVTSAALARLSEHVVGEDTASIAVTAGHAAGVIHASMAAAGHPPQAQDELEVLGERGRIYLRGKKIECFGPHPALIEFDPAVNYQASYDNAIAHFVEALRTGAAFQTPPAVHLQALRHVERIYAIAIASR